MDDPIVSEATGLGTVNVQCAISKTSDDPLPLAMGCSVSLARFRTQKMTGEAYATCHFDKPGTLC